VDCGEDEGRNHIAGDKITSGTWQRTYAACDFGVRINEIPGPGAAESRDVCNPVAKQKFPGLGENAVRDWHRFLQAAQVLASWGAARPCVATNFMSLAPFTLPFGAFTR
jgi:hypothetical protein